MEKIQFETQTLTIVSSKVCSNSDYDDEPFPELRILFDNEDTDIACSYIETSSVTSDLNMIESIYEILKCQDPSKMVGCKMLELRYRIKNILDKWTPWECAGFGSVDSDKFIAQCGDGTIMTKSELEERLKDMYCH